MRTRYRAAMDGVMLEALSEQLYVADIQEKTPVQALSLSDVMGYDGQRVTEKRRRSLEITITFQLRLYDPASRQRALSAVCAWCQGRYLTASTRPGQRLCVTCKALPAASALKWTETLSASFLAVSPPYWEEERPAFAGGLGAASLYVPGSTPRCPADVTITARENLDSLRIQTPLSMMRFAGLSLAPGDQLRAMHDDFGRLQLEKHANGVVTSAYALRTGESDDELWIPCGKRSEITCDGNAYVAVSCRGWWM